MTGDDRSVVLAPHLQDGKEAFQQLVGAYGGQVAAEALVGKSQARLSAYGGKNTPYFPPLDVIDALEARTEGLPGWPHITRWFCRRRGGLFLPLPGVGRTLGRWSVFIARLGREAGELISGICTDLSDDNELSPAEARRRLKDAAELVRVAVELEHALKARAGEEG
jgi:hypothetical protein